MNKRFKLGRNNINGQNSSNLRNPEKLNFNRKESFRQQNYQLIFLIILLTKVLAIF